MLTPITRHREKLPALGSIGFIADGRDRFGQTLFFEGRKRRCIVESYPLLNRRGISLQHCINVRFLDNGERCTFSGFYFKTQEDIDTEDL